MPTGPVTHGKAWIEMIHRYLATGVGALITLTMLGSWWLARRGRVDTGPSTGWATLTFAWVVAQGAFGALTVTMKLYPAIVTLHLLGGIGLLALLMAQWRQQGADAPLPLSAGLRRAAWVVAGLVVLQVALGGWVSTNYAVLACNDFPGCHAGQTWPAATVADYAEGFTLRRPLGHTAEGELLGFAALTAIHWVHRLGALLVFIAVAALARALWNQQPASSRRHALGLALAALWQFATGMSNVVLDWPLPAAVAHTGGAAALVLVLTSLLALASRPSSSSSPALRPVQAQPT
jgi:cytochrome c oxidase assembly protein subunit 15